MNVAYDRRQILGLIHPHFPALPEDVSSDELHGFLNAQTGLNIPVDELNSSAFDKWRKVLAEQGLPVWKYTQSQLDKIRADGLTLKTYVDSFRAKEGERMAALSKEAPTVTAEALLKNAADLAKTYA